MGCRPVSFVWRHAVLGGVVAVLAGCAVKPGVPQAPKPPEPVVCKAQAGASPLHGAWLSVRKQKGVAGELHTLFTLRPDGTMAYAERLKRGRNPSQGLGETGCWNYDGKVITLRTLESNGERVNPDDPIFVNRYTVLGSTAASLVLEHGGERIQAKKMPPDYRLPL